MKARTFLTVVLYSTLLVTMSYQQASATSGFPDSPRFGYGARLDIHGHFVEDAITTVTGMGMDWIALDFDWSRIWSSPQSEPDLASLSYAIDLARLRKLNVLLSVTNAPAWASTPQGPDPDITANLVLILAKLYPDSLKAIELFPGANTYWGWGAKPNPHAYLELLRASFASLVDASQSVTIIPSVTPNSGPPAQEEWDAILFLEEIYQAGGQPLLSIIGIRYRVLSGDPMFSPEEASYPVLRYYEKVRSQMLEKGHQNGLIWITGFSWPVGSETGAGANATEIQAAWLVNAYRLLKAQLFIGAAFFSNTNPDIQGPTQNAFLVWDEKQLHPACNQLRQLIFDQVGAVSEIISNPSTTTNNQNSGAIHTELVKRILNKPGFKSRSS